ncbi:MAG: hypothetical protein HY443_02050 [Candidatus Nealsonbacteria bacterium]|nr:hypothetical protein [Candidatus Nealsonbacteria bacterium]
MLTFTSISTGLTSIFYFLAGLSAWRSWQKSKFYLSGYFVIFLLAFGVQQMLFSLASGPISLDIRINAWLWAAAHLFMFISLCYFIRVPLRMSFPKLEKTIFKIAIVYAVIGSFVLFLNAPQLTAKLEPNGVYLFKVPPVSVLVIVSFTTLTMLFSAITLLRAFFKNSLSLVYRVRGLVLGLGMIVYLTSGPAHNLIKSPRGTILVDALLILAGFLFIAGVYLPKILKVKEEEASV